SAKSHAFTANWNHVKQKYDSNFTYIDIGDGFRADLGFIPQVGYREADASFGLRFYPEHSQMRFIRPSVFAFEQKDLDGNVIQRTVSLGVFAIGPKNLNVGLTVRPEEEVRVGDQLLSQTWGDFNIQIDPTRWLPRIFFEVRTGDAIDF